MRSPIGLVLALALIPWVAFAQAGPPLGVISRDQYVQRAAVAASQRFDAIDTNHTGYITREQIRAYVMQRRGASAGCEGPSPPGGFSRDQYVQRATVAASRRFDAIDTSHTGYITREQIRAYVMQHRGGLAGCEGPPASQ